MEREHAIKTLYNTPSDWEFYDRWSIDRWLVIPCQPFLAWKVNRVFLLLTQKIYLLTDIGVRVHEEWKSAWTTTTWDDITLLLYDSAMVSQCIWSLIYFFVKITMVPCLEIISNLVFGCSTYNSLYAGAKGGVLLGWYKRLEITVGIAQGLDYLHSFAVCIPLKLIANTISIPI